MSQDKDISLIIQSVHDYFYGMHEGDVARLRKAFHPNAFLFGYYHGEFSRISLEEWLAEVIATAKPVESGEKFDMQIVAADVTGPTAMVKVVVLYVGLRFTDYLTLMKVEGKWKIINKTYHHD